MMLTVLMSLMTKIITHMMLTTMVLSMSEFVLNVLNSKFYSNILSRS